MTATELQVMEGEMVKTMCEVMKDLEIKLVQSLLLDFAQVVAKDEVGPMRQHLDRLAQLGHAKQCVGTYSAHLSTIANIEFEKMAAENFVAALERLISTRLNLIVKHRPIIRVLCDAMSEAGFALELLAEIKSISDAKIDEIMTQYSHERDIVAMHQCGPPWGLPNAEAGMEAVDERLNEVVVLCQNCVLYNRFFESEMAALDAEWKRHVRLEVDVAQRVQELAVHYVLLEQQYLEYGIKLAIKRDLRPKIALLTQNEDESDNNEGGSGNGAGTENGSKGDNPVQEPEDSLMAAVDQLVEKEADTPKPKENRSSHCSSMVEQVFMLLHKSCVRAISMLNGTGANMLLHHVTSELLAPEGAFCKEMAKRWRRDEALEDIIVNLNNMATSGQYMMRLKGEILKNAEQLEKHDREQLGHMMSILDELATTWSGEVNTKIRGPEGFVRSTVR